MPDQIEDGDSGRSPVVGFDLVGWPIVDLRAEQTCSRIFGSRKLIATKVASALPKKVHPAKLRQSGFGNFLRYFHWPFPKEPFESILGLC